MIQTGVVTAVYGSNREVFGHSINTYEGCSGAIIFLLDKDQPPESVESHDYGKAIGVHAAGYVPHNLGMSLIEAFHRMHDEYGFGLHLWLSWPPQILSHRISS